MSQQDVEDQQALAADDIDPEADSFKLEDLFSPREGTPQEIIDAYYNKDVYGPEVGPANAWICTSHDMIGGSSDGHVKYEIFAPSDVQAVLMAGFRPEEVAMVSFDSQNQLCLCVHHVATICYLEILLVQFR